MPQTTILCGIALIIVGVAGYVHGMMNDKQSITALIPAFIGILLEFLGFLSMRAPDMRKHLMHAAVLVALVGFLASAWRLFPKLGGDLTLTAPVISQGLTALICLLFVFAGIGSFISARRGGQV